MLIRITNRCYMGCKHCMVDASGPDGEHMELKTFRKTLAFAKRLHLPLVMISGGEPFEHPQVWSFFDELKKEGFHVAVATNGSFLENQDFLERALSYNFFYQVTNVPGLYPRDYGHFEKKIKELGNHFLFSRQLHAIMPCRRTAENGIKQTRIFPSCYNLRAFALKKGSIIHGIAYEMSRTRFCKPSINVDGSVRIGEMDICYKIGEVTDSLEEIDRSLISMQCNRCGLLENLDNRMLMQLGLRKAS